MESSSWLQGQGHKTSAFPLRAVLLSLMLHALLLGMSPRIAVNPDSTAQARVLQAVLLSAAVPVSPGIATPIAVPPHQVRQTVAERTRNSATFAVPPATQIGLPAVTPILDPMPLQDTLVNGQTDVARQSRAMPNAVNTAAMTQSEERGPDAAGLRQFRLALASEARRFRRYPEVARRAGLSGTVEVRVIVDAGGLARRTDLTRSSGHEVLDTAALEMLHRAVARTGLPESLRGQEFAVLLPVVFAVEE